MYAILKIDTLDHSLQVTEHEGKLVTSELKIDEGGHTLDSYKLYDDDGELLAEDVNPTPFVVDAGKPTELLPVLVFINGGSSPPVTTEVTVLSYGFTYAKAEAQTDPSEVVTIDFVALLGALESELSYYLNSFEYRNIDVQLIMNGIFSIGLWKNNTKIGHFHYGAGQSNPLSVTFTKSNDPNDTYVFVIHALRYSDPPGSIVNINSGKDGDWIFTMAGDGDIPVNAEGQVFFTMYPDGMESNAIPAHQFWYDSTPTN